MSVTRPAAPRPAVDLNGQLSLHPQFTSTVVPIGAAGVSVLVVDNFLSRPQILVDYAAGCVFEGVTDTFYPGCAHRYRRSTASRCARSWAA